VPFEVWFPVSTFIAGFAGSLLTEALRDKRLATREREAREAERELIRTQRRDDFQRETLLPLQEALQDLGRATMVLHIEDSQKYRETGDWGRSQLSPEWNETNPQAQGGVQVLKVRVLDDDLRRLIQEMTEASTNVLLVKSEAEAELHMREMTLQNVDVQERLGELLRNLY
jgi:hypothetical protein